MIRQWIFIILFFPSLILFGQNDTFYSGEESVYPSENTGSMDFVDSVYIPETANFKQGLTDSSEISAEYDPSLFNTFKNNKDFQYNEVQQEESLWDIIKQKFYEWLLSFMREASSGGILSWVLIILIVALAVFILLRITDKNTGFYKNKEFLPKVTMDDNIQEIEFSSLIADAENRKDYNEAIRYQFLNLLKTLINTGHIKWKPSKTNTDYFYELKDNRVRSEFKDLALIFDYADYSDFKFDQRNYLISKSKFVSFMDNVGVKT